MLGLKNTQKLFFQIVFWTFWTESIKSTLLLDQGTLGNIGADQELPYMNSDRPLLVETWQVYSSPMKPASLHLAERLPHTYLLTHPLPAHLLPLFT